MFIIAIIQITLVIVFLGPNLLLGSYLLWQFVAMRRRGEGKSVWVSLWLIGWVFLALGLLLLFWQLGSEAPFLPIFLTLVSNAFWYIAARWCRQDQSEAAHRLKLTSAEEEAGVWPPQPRTNVEEPEQPPV